MLVIFLSLLLEEIVGANRRDIRAGAVGLPSLARIGSIGNAVSTWALRVKKYGLPMHLRNCR